MDSHQQPKQPLIPATTYLPELTVKVVVLSILLAILLAAANAYLALRIGTTIAASIPASVLAMGILSLFKHSNVLESNIVQTSASAGEGIAAAISFVLPAMIVLHVWQSFPYWETLMITIIGGILGVLFSIPLRRVFLFMPDLRFPEGTAVGNVLSVIGGSKRSDRLKLLLEGAGVGALLSFGQSGLKVIANHVELWMVSGRTLFGAAFGFEPALFAAGFIVGWQVGFSMLVGLVLGWIIMPILSLVYGLPPVHGHYAMFLSLWKDHLRFVGVGIMLVGGIWTLLGLIRPIVKALVLLAAPFQGSGAAGDTPVIPRTERDISMMWMLLGVAVMSILLFLLLFHTEIASQLVYSPGYLLITACITLIFVFLVGFMLASVSSYFAGILGSTNNPLSGILIIAVLLLGVMYTLFFHKEVVLQVDKIAALIIVVAAIMATIIVISLENIQDLKAGQMVGATPWKQQLILCVGVITSALVIGPIIDLLYHAYGIGGVFPHTGMDEKQMLAAPQAVLMATLARGVLSYQLNWPMLSLGILISIVVIMVDKFLKTKNKRLLILAVGVGMYLPPETVAPIIMGALVSLLVQQSRQKSMAQTESEHLGTLLACGIVAGSALMGVFLSIPFVLLGSTDALAIISNHIGMTTFFAILSSIGLCWWLYRVGKS